jgi:hypothetical protein
MAEARPPQPVKLICGILTAQGCDLELIRRVLADAFGPIDRASEVWPFDQTRYYEPQMGAGLVRQFVAFERPRDPGELASIKRRTNGLERELTWQVASRALRPVNLDPGYVGLSQLVLASTKASAHRIYLQDGIYAEVTLQFAHGEWQTMPWTYPDYRQTRYHGYLKDVRQTLHQQLSLTATSDKGRSQ